MFESLMSAAIVGCMLTGPPVPPQRLAPQQSTLAAAVMLTPVVTAPRVSRSVHQPASRDSLINGALIGAIAGGLVGAVLAGIGCALPEPGSSEGGSCSSGTMILVGIGTGLGAAIGVGVDALFEHGPSATMPMAGRRRGVQLRFGF